MKYYIHHVPGRLRMQTQVLHENEKKGDEFIAAVKALKGVTDVEVHTVTGSAIILFDEKIISCEQIIGFVEKNGYFRLAEAETCDQVIEKATEKVVEVAEKIAIDAIEGGIEA